MVGQLSGASTEAVLPMAHPLDMHQRLRPDVVSEPNQREAFQALLGAGLHDTVRPLVPTGYTYWDYKQLRFPRNEGLRIDFILGSHAFADAVVAASIHRDERKGEIPSDHVPVVVDLDLEGPDDDDRPNSTSR